MKNLSAHQVSKGVVPAAPRPDGPRYDIEQSSEVGEDPRVPIVVSVAACARHHQIAASASFIGTLKAAVAPKTPTW